MMTVALQQVFGARVSMEKGKGACVAPIFSNLPPSLLFKSRMFVDVGSLSK